MALLGMPSTCGYLWYLLVCRLLLWIPQTQGTCGPPCFCQVLQKQVYAHCAMKGLYKVPRNLPSNATSIDLSFNHFITIDRRTFRGDLSRVTQLDLRNNVMKGIEYGAFDGLVHLRELYLDNNALRTLMPGVLSSIRTLNVLSLAGNRFTALSDNTFTGVQLDRLNLQNNIHLREISEEAFTNASVHELILNGCDLQVIEPGTFSSLVGSLRILQISRNRSPLVIKRGSFAEANIETLYLSHLGLKSLDFLKDTAVILDVDLSHNDLVDLDLCILGGLAYTSSLQLSYNHLTTLRCTTGVKRTHLEHLDLSSNMLQDLEPGVLQVLPGLTTLLLQDNPLSSLTLPHDGTSRLDYIDLTNVPVNCDCRMRWVSSYGGLIQGLGCNVSLVENTGCSTPHNIRLETVPSHGNVDKVVEVVCQAEGNPAPHIMIIFTNTSQDIHAGETLHQNTNNKTKVSVHVNRSTTINEFVTCTADSIMGRINVTIPLMGRAVPDIHQLSLDVLSGAGALVLLGVCLIMAVVLFRGRLGSKSWETQNHELKEQHGRVTDFTSLLALKDDIV